jgi:hypothetical protein
LFQAQDWAVRTKEICLMIKQFAAGLTVALLATAVIAADPAIKSGPQVNEKLAGPFHPLNITGAKAGEKNCLYCENGNNPVAMIFARETSPALTKLIKKIDEATAKNKAAEMGSFVVFCSDKDGLDKELAGMAKENGIKSCVLAIDNPAGPKGYNVEKDADVTVVLYTERTVKANYAFKKGQLNDKAIDTIVADISKIIPAK